MNEYSPGTVLLTPKYVYLQAAQINKRIANLHCGFQVWCLALVTDGNIAVAYEPIELLMALFLHILECRHIHDKPLEEGGDGVRASKEQVVQAVLQVPQAILSMETNK